MKERYVWFAVLMLCVAPLSYSQAVGEFDGQMSIGDDGGIGEANFSDGTYEVLASGNDIWGTADGMYWIFKEVSGSFIATVDCAWGPQEIPGGSDDVHAAQSAVV